jgi:CBS domain-containing protein
MLMKNYQQKAVETKSPQREFNPAPVSEYMTPLEKLFTFHPDTEIVTAVDVLLENQIAGAPVLNDKMELVGLIDDKDCLKVLFDIAYHNQPVLSSTVADYMTSVMKTIPIHANIVEVADTFLHTKYKRLLVVDDKGKLRGQISRQDILRAIHDFNARANK